MKFLVLVALGVSSGLAATAAGETCNAEMPPTDCSETQAAYADLEYTRYEKDANGNTVGVEYENTQHLYCGVDTATCGDVCNRGVTAEEREAILKVHNDFRRLVASGGQKDFPATAAANDGTDRFLPKAVNMYEMVWDDELAAGAQLWADQCTWAHTKNDITADFDSAGQNLAMSSYTGDSVDVISDMASMWYDSEVAFFTSAKISPFVFASDYGHFSQVVWASSTHVGCGVIQFNPGTGMKRHLVCNYGPAGNYGDMYETGDETGSRCESDADGDGLCDPGTDLVPPPANESAACTSVQNKECVFGFTWNGQKMTACHEFFGAGNGYWCMYDTDNYMVDKCPDNCQRME